MSVSMSSAQMNLSLL